MQNSAMLSKKRKIELPSYKVLVLKNNNNNSSTSSTMSSESTNQMDQTDLSSNLIVIDSSSLTSSTNDLTTNLTTNQIRPKITVDFNSKCVLKKLSKTKLNLVDQAELKNLIAANKSLINLSTSFNKPISSDLNKSQSYQLEFNFNRNFNNPDFNSQDFNNHSLNESSRSNSLNLQSTNKGPLNNDSNSSLTNLNYLHNSTLNNQLDSVNYDDFINRTNSNEEQFEVINNDEDDLINDVELNNELNQSQSNSSFNLSILNENENSNLSSNNSNDFEYLDLDDHSINLAKPPNLEEWLDLFHNWTHNERLVALESLVDSEICDIQQIRFLMSIIEPQLQRDFISLLPKELALFVLSFLEPKDLLKAAQTCRYWRILCEDNLLWREKCKEYGLRDEETLSELFRKRAVRNANRNVLTPAVSPVSSPSTSSSLNHLQQQQQAKTNSNLFFNLTNLTNNQLQNGAFQRSEYKMAYLRQRGIEHNWRYGRFPTEADNTNTKNVHNNAPKGRLLKEILHLKGHDDHVITCLQFDPQSNIIVSGSDDNTLKVWSSVNGRCLQTLTGHSGGVWSSALGPGDSPNENIVVSGSTDRTLKIWNALTGECKHTLYGHTSTVRCMALHGNYVVSGSRDQSLRIWDITTGRCCHQLIGHTGAVRCVQFNGEIVVSGAYDFLVKVWDAKTETCLHTLNGHTNRVYSLQFDGINIVSGSLDTSIRVWSAKTGQLKHTLVGHQSLTSGMQLKGSILVSGNADSTVKIWNINTGDCLQTLAGTNKHLSAVTCLQFNSNFVITSSDDGTVKLWELKTGEFIRNLVSLPSGGSGGVVWRIRASNTKLVCAIGSRNGTEETSLKLIDFDIDDLCENDLDNSLTGTYAM